jgi:eukaryotic-like serine/threonine-protein kinase
VRARRAELARAFGVLGVAYAHDIERAAATKFADYATQWQSAYVDACRATHVSATQTPATLDLRVACLDDKRRHLDALVTRLSRVEQTQLGAVPDAIAGLPDLQECADLKALSTRAPSPAHGEQAAEYDRLADELEAINVSRDLGDYKGALAQAEQAQTAVDALGHKSLQAKYRYIRGELLDHLGRGEEAIPLLEQALYLAEAARDQETKITSLVRLYIIVGARKDKAAAERWSKLAEAALDAGPTAQYARSYFLMAQGMDAYGADDMKRAAAKFEESLAIARQDPESTLTMGLLQNLASVYYMQERDAEAKQLWEEAVAYAQRHYGPNHPSLGVILGNIGLFELNTGDPKGAVVHLQRALDIHVASLGPQHPIVGHTHLRIGDALAKQDGPRDPIYAHYKAAIDNFSAAYPGGDPHLTDALTAYAIFANEQKEYRTALSLYERALASEHEADKANSPTIYKLVHGLGAEHLELGEHAQAIPLLERALGLRQRHESASVLSLALIERDLARAYAETGKRAKARTLATRALGRLRGAKGDFAEPIQELETTLAKLR